jgi:two-component system sensor histidine kinase SenX3
VVGGAVAAVEGFATSRGVELVDVGVVDAVVSGDRDQLTSAVRNLLDNAITYTAAKGEGGTVRYRTTVEEGQAAIEVQDTGIGIPVRYRDRIFERFFRVDRARSRESGGTGLGLSIVRNVARVHGGSVAMTSEVGEGSTFVIRLPVADGWQGEVSA